MNVNNEFDATMARNHFTTTGKRRAIFEMFYQFRHEVIRRPGVPEKNCRRGDKFPEDILNYQQLQSVLRYFVRDRGLWKRAEICDNNINYNEEDRKILIWVNGRIEKNLLHNYSLMLQDFPLPDWLK